MASIESFLQTLREKINRDIEEILKKAEMESEKIIKEAEESARRLILEAASSAIVAYRRETLSKVELEIRRELFRVKSTIFDKISQIVRDRIKEIIEGRANIDYYNEIFYRLLKEACEKLGDSEIIVQTNERDLEWLSKNKQEVELRLSKDLGKPIKIIIDSVPINSMGGVIIYSKDGRRYFINTIESRLNSVLSKHRNNIGRKIKEVLKKYGLEAI